MKLGPREESSEPNSAPSLTRLLQAAGEGDAAASGAVLSRVYEELRALAQRRLAEERVGHTLQATALVNEAYLRLVDADGALRFAGRKHFFHAAAEAMRRVLIGYARARSRFKRGGGGRRVPLNELTGVADLAAADAEPWEILAVDDAIRRLEDENPHAGAVVMLRFYAGLSLDEIAEHRGTSPRTVYRQWAYARAWLYRELKGGTEARDANADAPPPP